MSNNSACRFKPMSNYQKIYEKKAGTAKLSIRTAVAGQKINCRLTYKAGFYGIDDSGSLKLLFRLASDFEEFQFTNPNTDNFVKISSSNKNVKIQTESRSSGALGKIYIRPWSRGITLNISESFLKENEEVYIDFSNWKIQTFYEKTFEFKFCVDPFATGKYVEIEKSPEIEIIPDKPFQLKIIAPTQVNINTPFKALIKIEDQHGNPCRYQKGVFDLKKNPKIDGLSEKVKFANGKAILKLKITQEGAHFISASFRDISGDSNPIVGLSNPKHNPYWAELHAQSEETVGTNDVVDYFNFAKNYAFVDVASHQANDFQVTNGTWNKINKTTKAINKNGEFVAFPGYEWSGNTPLGGDRNVIYLKENNPIFRSSHALVDDFEDIGNDAPTVEKLFKKLKAKKAIVFAHVGGRYANLSLHNKKIERAIEIHSCWGTFEWFFHDALKRDYQIGVVANSDGHKGRPGASYPGTSYFGSFGGLTCIIAPKLTREDIFNSLYNRHCYATTGARIYLDVNYSLSEKKGVMGDIVKITDMPILKVTCCGTSAIDRIEIWNKDKKIYTYFPPIIEKSLIKIAYSGSKVKGRGRSMIWEGKVQLKDNAFQGKIDKVNFFNPNNYIETDSKILKWRGETTGGIQALIFDLENNQGELEMKINNKEFILPIKNINQIPKIFNMGGLDAKVEVYRVSENEETKIINFKYKPKKLNDGNNPVFVKVIQKNGHMAWSSPIYFIK
jgi:hypothetical protein